MAVERRKTRRATIPGMRVVFESAAGLRVEADVLDVGSGGMFIRTAQPVSAGKRLSLEVAPLAGFASWTALGRVVWTRDRGTMDAPPGMGVKLIDVDEAVVAVIDRAVEARERARSGHEPAARADGDVADVHGMTTRVVEVPRMVEPEAAPREEEAALPPLPPARAPERSIAIDLVPAIDLVAKKPPVEVEAAPQRDSPLPELRPRRGRWALLVLLVALAATALYVARDDIPWVKRLVETDTALPPAPTPAGPFPALPSATAPPTAPPAESTVRTWTMNRPPEDAPTASKTPVRPPPSASPPAAATGGGATDNPY